jgi:uncharacterized membrane protein YjgN (DUF898 family)
MQLPLKQDCRARADRPDCRRLNSEQFNREGSMDEQGNRAAQHLRIKFSGSGSEYFRIWIVNLLLSVLTLGLYLPFAKARRLRYFYANTWIDGQALSFHGDPWRMFRGFLLLLLLAIAYGAAGHF